MVAKCANPVCCVPFRYLHLGRVFRVEILRRKRDETGFGNGCASTVEHYWLCHVCSTSLTVAVERGEVVIRPQRSSETAASRPAARRPHASTPSRRTSAVSFQQNESVVG